MKGGGRKCFSNRFSYRTCGDCCTSTCLCTYIESLRGSKTSVTHTTQIDRNATANAPDHLTKNYWGSEPYLRHLLTSGTETPPAINTRVVLLPRCCQVRTSSLSNPCYTNNTKNNTLGLGSDAHLIPLHLHPRSEGTQPGVVYLKSEYSCPTVTRNNYQGILSIRFSDTPLEISVGYILRPEHLQR